MKDSSVSSQEAGRVAGQKACVMFATLALVHQAWSPEQYHAYIRRYGLADHQDDIEQRIAEGRATPHQIDAYTWCMEGLYMLLWMLGQIEGPMLDVTATGSLEGIDALEDMEYDPDPWLETLELPQLSELGAYEEPLLMAQQAPPDKAHPDVVAERLWAIAFLKSLHGEESPTKK